MAPPDETIIFNWCMKSPFMDAPMRATIQQKGTTWNKNSYESPYHTGWESPVPEIPAYGFGTRTTQQEDPVQKAQSGLQGEEGPLRASYCCEEGSLAYPARRGVRI